MARSLRIAALALLLTLLLGNAPALAQTGKPAVQDLGNNIYHVDGTRQPIPNLLPADEVQKIARLQSAPVGAAYQILSPVSPDDQAVLAGTTTGDLFFVNIRDGAITPLQLKQPLLPASNFFWLDDSNLGAMGVVLEPSAIQPLMINRHTGVVTYENIPFPGAAILAQPGQSRLLPVLVSRNQRKILVAEIESDNVTVRIPPPATPGSAALDASAQSRQAPFRARFAREFAAQPRMLALADLAQQFEPIASTSGILLGTLATGAPIPLRVLDTATGEVRDVMRLEANTTIVDVSFSQDGSRFSIITQNSPSGDGSVRATYDGARLSEIPYRDVTGNLPPDQNPYFQSNTLTTLEFASGEVRTMRAANGDGVVYVGAGWSTDNQTLMVTASAPGRMAGRRYPQYEFQYQAGRSLRFYDGQLREVRRLERIEISSRSMTASFISPDEVLIVSQYGTNAHPYYYNLRSGEFRTIADRAGTFATVVPTNQSREIVFVYSSFTDPADLYRMRWDGTGLARVTWFNEEVRRLSQTKQYPVAFTLRNGERFEGVLILPADVAFPPKNMPIVVWQQGGPVSALPNMWAAAVEAPFSLLPNFGFGVLVVPLYGRIGVGPERFEALADGANFGQGDIDVQAEIANQLRTRGWAGKVGITGCSYGGYFTTQSIVRHPTTYDAAHTMCSIIDLIVEWNRGYDTLAPWLMGLPPHAALEEYRRDSPAYNAGRVRTPLLAFHGTKDFLPITLMENFMLQVINNGVPAKLLRFQDAEHGFVRTEPAELSKAYELYGAQEQILWFRRHLGQ